MASIDFRGKGYVYGAHYGLPVRALVAVAERSTLKGGEAATNLLVAGSQLEALKALTVRYKGVIDVIYAVPPYNTGSDGWRYDDEIASPLTQEWKAAGLTGRDDPDRHDKWLGWMTPRIRLMYELLAEDGVFFISIDDNEGHRLKLLLDEIFGEHNALPTLVWQKRYSVPSDVKGIGFVHETILVYRKSGRFEPSLVPQTAAQLARYKNRDNDSRGNWKSADYTCKWSKQQRPNLYYPIRNPFTNEDVWPNEKRVWAYSKAETAKNIVEDMLWWGKGGKNSVPAFKNFVETLPEGMVPGSLLLHDDVGHTQTAANELEELLPEAKKDGKPLALIRQLLWIAGKPNGTVLFPFPSAGEGAQAVALTNMECDEAGGAERKFIVLLPDDESDELVRARLDALSRSVVPARYGYFKLGNPVDGDALLRTDTLPSFEEIARHVFFSATGRVLEVVEQNDPVSLIGVVGDADLHLIYKPSKEFLRSDNAMLTESRLNAILKARKPGRRSIVFAVGKYLPHSDLVAADVEFCAFLSSIYRAIAS